MSCVPFFGSADGDIIQFNIRGALTLDGAAVSAGQFISASDINSGKLKFTPATNGYGTPYTSFTFQVRDDGGTDLGGLDLDQTARTMTLG